MRRVSAPTSRVAIIGVGMSALVADLIRYGYTSLDVVDVSPAALGRLNEQLVGAADRVRSVCADVRDVRFDGPIDVWHDRATLHFLTSAEDQAAYAARAADAVRPGGYIVLATFSERGPRHCSGLPVTRHDLTSLRTLFAGAFEVVEAFERDHHTPWGAAQAFTHVVLQRTRARPPRSRASGAL